MNALSNSPFTPPSNGNETLPPLPRALLHFKPLSLLEQGTREECTLASESTPGGQGRLVVVHWVDSALSRDEQFRSEFVATGQRSLKLKHPNILRVLNVGAQGSQCYWVTDYVRGMTLAKLSREQPHGAPLPLNLQLMILSNVLKGLQYAHAQLDSQGIPSPVVHRHLCPSQILVSFEGQCKIAGYAVLSSTDTTFGRLENEATELAYVAPERCLGKGASPLTDLYAVGGILWEALAQRPRRTGRNREEAIRARLGDLDPDIEDVWPDVAPELAAITRRALAWAPSDRYQSADEFLRDLNAYLEPRNSRSASNRVRDFMRRFSKEGPPPAHDTILPAPFPASEETPVVSLATLVAKRREDLPELLPAPAVDDLFRPSSPPAQPLRPDSIAPVASVAAPSTKPPVPTSHWQRKLTLVCGAAAVAGLGWWYAPSSPSRSPSTSAGSASLKTRVEALPLPKPDAEPAAQKPASVAESPAPQSEPSQATRATDTPAKALDVPSEPPEATNSTDAVEDSPASSPPKLTSPAKPVSSQVDKKKTKRRKRKRAGSRRRSKKRSTRSKRRTRKRKSRTSSPLFSKENPYSRSK